MSEAEAVRAVREDVDGMRDFVLRERPRKPGCLSVSIDVIA